MITLRDVQAGYGDHIALRDLCCVLRPDRTTAVLGPGGSGKSTLLRILAGAPRPDAWCSGVVDGVTRPVSWMTQHHEPAELLTTPGSLLGPEPERERAVARVWGDGPAAALVRGALDAPLSSLSPSTRRIVALTAALARPAGLVLLDEPEAGASPRELAWISAALDRMRGQRTVVLVTHSLELAGTASDDALFLLDGILIEAAATDTFFNAPVNPRTRDLITYGG
jgi:ABC-type phosphate transport system ATPase subunit